MLYEVITSSYAEDKPRFFKNTKKVQDAHEAIRPADFAGRKAVVYFYPKDDTPGCTTEAKDFSALRPALLLLVLFHRFLLGVITSYSIHYTKLYEI